MPLFQYDIRAAGGERRQGQREAVDSRTLAAELSRSGAVVLSIRAASVAAAAAARPAARKFEFGAPADINEVIVFSHQIAALLRAGISIVRAMRGLSESTGNSRFALVLETIAVDLESGSDLASSLGRHPKLFGELYVSVVHVGEQTGRLDEAFEQISAYLELERETVKRVKSATRYPIFVLLAISAAIVLLNVYVIPAFADVFSKYNAELPWQTQMILSVSAFFTDYGFVMLVLLVAGGFWLRGWLRTQPGRLRWDGWKLRLPLLGSIFNRINLARFCQTFAMVLRAGLPVTQSLHVVSSALGNEFMSVRVRAMRSGIERGESITQTARDTGLFPPVVLQMIAVGEETGAVDELLAQVARFYEEEIDYELKGLTEAIEPLLITVVAGLVLVLALGVFLPLWDLSSVANR